MEEEKLVEAKNGGGVGDVCCGSKLVKSFTDASERKVWATRNVSILVRPGEVLGLLGPNGAGKSTLFNLLTADPYTGKPNSGTVKVNGKDIYQSSFTFSSAGFASQVDTLFPGMTGREQLRFYARISGMILNQNLQSGEVETMDYSKVNAGSVAKKGQGKGESPRWDP